VDDPRCAKLNEISRQAVIGFHRSFFANSYTLTRRNGTLELSRAEDSRHGLTRRYSRMNTQAGTLSAVSPVGKLGTLFARAGTPREGRPRSGRGFVTFNEASGSPFSPDRPALKLSTPIRRILTQGLFFLAPDQCLTDHFVVVGASNMPQQPFWDLLVDEPSQTYQFLRFARACNSITW
jgi:hypothetical protein